MAQIWPVGIDRIGSRIYFFFMAVNLVCVPIIWLLYPETKTRSLEDMDVLFGAERGSAAAAGEYGEVDNFDGNKGGRTRLTSAPVGGLEGEHRG